MGDPGGDPGHGQQWPTSLGPPEQQAVITDVDAGGLAECMDLASAEEAAHRTPAQQQTGSTRRPALRATPTDERTETGWRCFETSHSLACQRCTIPPSVEHEHDYQLTGDKGKKNGESRLRSFLLGSPYWNDAEARETLAKECEEAGMNDLVLALRTKNASILRKRHLLMMARSWRYKSDLWQLRPTKTPQMIADSGASGGSRSVNDAEAQGPPSLSQPYPFLNPQQQQSLGFEFRRHDDDTQLAHASTPGAMLDCWRGAQFEEQQLAHNQPVAASAAAPVAGEALPWGNPAGEGYQQDPTPWATAAPSFSFETGSGRGAGVDVAMGLAMGGPGGAPHHNGDIMAEMLMNAAQDTIPLHGDIFFARTEVQSPWAGAGAGEEVGVSGLQGGGSGTAALSAFPMEQSGAGSSGVGEAFAADATLSEQQHVLQRQQVAPQHWQQPGRLPMQASSTGSGGFAAGTGAKRRRDQGAAGRSDSQPTNPAAASGAAAAEPRRRSPRIRAASPPQSQALTAEEDADARQQQQQQQLVPQPSVLPLQGRPPPLHPSAAAAQRHAPRMQEDNDPHHALTASEAASREAAVDAAARMMAAPIAAAPPQVQVNSIRVYIAARLVELTKASAAGWACPLSRELSASGVAAAPAAAAGLSPALEWTHWQSDAVVLQSVTRRLVDLFASGVPTIVQWAQKLEMTQNGASVQAWRALMTGRQSPIEWALRALGEVGSRVTGTLTMTQAAAAQRQICIGPLDEMIISEWGTAVTKMTEFVAHAENLLAMLRLGRFTVYLEAAHVLLPVLIDFSQQSSASFGEMASWLAAARGGARSAGAASDSGRPSPVGASMVVPVAETGGDGRAAAVDTFADGVGATATDGGTTAAGGAVERH